MFTRFKQKYKPKNALVVHSAFIQVFLMKMSYEHNGLYLVNEVSISGVCVEKGWHRRGTLLKKKLKQKENHT